MARWLLSCHHHPKIPIHAQTSTRIPFPTHIHHIFSSSRGLPLLPWSSRLLTASNSPIKNAEFNCLAVEGCLVVEIFHFCKPLGLRAAKIKEMERQAWLHPRVANSQCAFQYRRPHRARQSGWPGNRPRNSGQRHPDLINPIALCRDDMHERKSLCRSTFLAALDGDVLGCWDCGTSSLELLSFIHGCNWAILKYIDNSMSPIIYPCSNLSFFHKVPV